MAATQREEVAFEDPMDNALKELYYNPEDAESYGGVEKLLRSTMKAGVKGVTRVRVK